MSLHRRIAPEAVGPSGAEGLAAACMTSSLDNGMLIAPMLDLTPSVQSVLQKLHLLSSIFSLGSVCTPNYTDAVVSVFPTTIGCSDGGASIKPVQQKLHLLVQFVAAIIWIGHGVSTLSTIL